MKARLEEVRKLGDQLRDLQTLARYSPIDRQTELEAAERVYRMKCGIVQPYIDKLENPKQRRVLYLRYLCGRTWPEIAEEMGYTDVKSALRIHGRALQKLPPFDPLMTTVPVILK